MKTVFKNRTFYYLLVSYIIALILWNAVLFFYYNRMMALLPISIQTILLILVFNKDKQAKVAIKAWVIIFQIGAFGLIAMGNSITILAKGFHAININLYSFALVEIVLGIVILIFIKKTVSVERPPIEKSEESQS